MKKKIMYLSLFMTIAFIGIADAHICETIYERCIDSNPYTGLFEGSQHSAYDKACLNSRTGCYIHMQ
ncbi:MAG: hypothetical protein JJ892_14965 [Balneola sp.]|nr:hypothetical protein [Balneola sp.]